eukprot:CAMPEP_0172534794 /NCGR_PEP_ID=MMETSP1067-20121228/7040_1 /TAXON_ID=265564 ORGANISM="Thalassiosira punctigera, Strain Tpunct2005C2" /NCGR_SAMPLE_ID=MMETSP1067 /ASSEMBLY_ACC=CAM_ASM_000444 /LENGTH=368 /DNA_ID=CAMNT_0013319631 /DNA_START=14 /DNA_END=1120 /DNA_ORIENTATION=+
MASAKTATMLSLLPRRSLPRGGAGGVARRMASKRSHSILAAASGGGNCAAHGTSHRRDDVSVSSHHHHHQRRHAAPNHPTHRRRCAETVSRRWLSYASVDHSAAYRAAMSSNHGSQLQLALEEGRGKDDAPFDPFSQFLDQMGNATYHNVEDFKGGEDIEEAEYETIEEHSGKGGDDMTGRDEEYDSDDSEEDEDDLEEEDADEGPVYTATGALARPESERLSLRAGYPAGGTFAVILLAGFQHKVAVDDLMVVNKLRPVSHWCVGSTHTFKDDDVLLMANQDKTLVGLPGVRGAEVDVMVEEITRDKTLIIFKKRRRKHSRRKNGFRRQVTFLRVLDIRMPKGEEVVKNDDGEGREDTMEEDVRVAA